MIAPVLTPTTRVFCDARHPITDTPCARYPHTTGLHVGGDGDDWTDDPEETT